MVYVNGSGEHAGGGKLEKPKKQFLCKALTSEELAARKWHAIPYSDGVPLAVVNGDECFCFVALAEKAFPPKNMDNSEARGAVEALIKAHSLRDPTLLHKLCGSKFKPLDRGGYYLSSRLRAFAVSFFESEKGRKAASVGEAKVKAIKAAHSKKTIDAIQLLPGHVKQEDAVQVGGGGSKAEEIGVKLSESQLDALDRIVAETITPFVEAPKLSEGSKAAAALVDIGKGVKALDGRVDSMEKGFEERFENVAMEIVKLRHIIVGLDKALSPIADIVRLAKPFVDAINAFREA